MRLSNCCNLLNGKIHKGIFKILNFKFFKNKKFEIIRKLIKG